MHFAGSLFLCTLLLVAINAGFLWLITQAAQTGSGTITSVQPAPEPVEPVEPVNFLSHPIKPQAHHVVAMFGHPSCGHSRAMAPVWNQVVQTLSDDPTVRLLAIHPDSTAILRLNTIQAFPTVLWGPSLDQPLTHEYEGPRNPAALVGAIARGQDDPAWRPIISASKEAEPVPAAPEPATTTTEPAPAVPEPVLEKGSKPRRGRRARTTLRA